MENVMQDELDVKLPLVCRTIRPWMACFSHLCFTSSICHQGHFCNNFQTKNLKARFWLSFFGFCLVLKNYFKYTYFQVGLFKFSAGEIIHTWILQKDLYILLQGKKKVSSDSLTLLHHWNYSQRMVSTFLPPGRWWDRETDVAWPIFLG